MIPADHNIKEELGVSIPRREVPQRAEPKLEQAMTDTHRWTGGVLQVEHRIDGKGQAQQKGPVG